MIPKFRIDPDIRKASTLPALFYKSQEVFEAIKNKIFYRSWHWLGENDIVEKPNRLKPLVLMKGFMDEPVIVTRDANNTLHCISNVCTHRGNLLVDEPKSAKKIICGYHGRRFALNGQFEFMPEFNEVLDFPQPCDSLHRFPTLSWGPLLFAGLNPLYDLTKVLERMEERIGFMPITKFKVDEKRSKNYTIDTHWALYCDNYLEGFHIPFVHKDLNMVLDYGNYDTLLFEFMNLQIGYADKDTDEVFKLPPGHIDEGKKIAAYYFWVFPNLMFNFYPWGLSLNVVEPVNMNKTKVRFVSYVYDRSKLGKGAGAELDKVEMEDEAVVEGVHKGLRSQFYKAGRFSPTKERGVHHFHSLLAEYLDR